MAVVWLILKIILWVLLGLLALVLLVLVLPITAYLEYSAVGGFKAAVGTLGLRFPVYPAKEKKKKRPEKKTENAQEETAPLEPQQAAEPEPLTRTAPQLPKATEARTEPPKIKQTVQPEAKAPKKTAAPKPQKQASAAKQPPKRKERDMPSRLLSILSTVKELIGIAGGALRRLLAGIWIHRICIVLPVHKGDAAETAIQTGRIHSAAGASLGVLQNFLHLSFKQYQIEPDYTGERQDEAFFSCKITSSLIIMLIVAVWALPKVLKVLKNSELEILPGR